MGVRTHQAVRENIIGRVGLCLRGGCMRMRGGCNVAQSRSMRFRVSGCLRFMLVVAFGLGYV